MISNETIQRIVDTTDVFDVISDFINLRRRGVNYIGLCPFHNEKTPSFTVSPGKGIYKCFGCGKGGNAINFVMEHEQMNYVEALRFLAKKYHIEIVETKISADQKERKNEREGLLVVTAFAESFFKELLHRTEDGKAIALSYLRERSFRKDIIEKFNIGYNPGKGISFSQTALEKGFQKDYLMKLGLSLENNNGLIDRFRGRIIFPIYSISGKTVGFGGRILNDDAKTAKYINSPESEIYQKGRLLYGLFYAKKSIIKNNKCFLVEGYTDVISLHQAGVENVVASSGTALTPLQISQIKRFTNNISVIFDGDNAGIKASLRNIDLILEQDMHVKVVPLPENEDPDSFAKGKSATVFQNYVVDNEQDFISYKTKLLLQDALNDPVKKANAIGSIIRSIALIPNSIVRSEYLKKCSDMFDVEEKTLYAEMSRILMDKHEKKVRRARTRQQQIAKQAVYINVNPCENEEKELIRFLLNYGNKLLFVDKEKDTTTNVATYIFNEFENDNIEAEGALHRIILEEYKHQMNHENFNALSYFRYHPDPKIVNIIVDILSEPYQLSEIWKKNRYEDLETRLPEIIPQLIYAFKQKKLQLLQKEIQKKLQQAKKDGNTVLINDLIKEKIWTDSIKSKIAKQLGDRIIF